MNTAWGWADLERLFAAEALEAIDLELARAIRQRLPAGAASDLVMLAAAFASRAVQNGHVCLELARLVDTPLLGKEGHVVEFSFPELTSWLSALKDCRLVSDGSARTPFVLDEQHRLYLQRYFDYQTRLILALRSRVADSVDFDAARFRAGLDRLFPRANDANLQAAAAVIAVSSRLAVISGGPGTGKTTTVAKLLTLLAEQAEGAGPAMRVTLVAPTGKAAQRLTSAIAASTATLDTSDSVRALIQKPASTIHRTLGFQSRRPGQFIHHRDNPLTTDVVVVDEASMVDIALMTKLVEAVPQNARLILLGDKDQLASVEAGAIFGDIYNTDVDHSVSLELAQRVASLTGVELAAKRAVPLLADSTIHLARSYRYDPDSAIARLARAVREGNVERALGALRQGDQDVRWLCPPEAPPGRRAADPRDELRQRNELGEMLREGYESFLAAEGARAKLAALGQFRVLSPHRKGQNGVAGLNALAERVLGNGLNPGHAEHYPGRPILITANDYQTELFNGDIGVIDKNDEGTGLAAYFETPTGIRQLHPSRLPAHETVFAMTVHKSQGSEFDRVALVLPDTPSPVLTRELLYTALTRARKGVLVRGTRSVLSAGIQASVQRASGLREGLWMPES
jgi:exodeoxyribonuclease V alpha subunit